MEKFDKTNSRQIAVIDLCLWKKTNKIKVRPKSFFTNSSDYKLYRYLISNVIRHKRKLEFFISQLSSRKINKLDIEVIVSLMVGLVQLDESSKIQDFAAINETVELMVLFEKPFLRGFVNAILRNYQRKKIELAQELAKAPMEITTSHPDWMVRNWQNNFGTKITTSICQADNIEPLMPLVFNPNFDQAKILDDLKNEGFEIISKNNHFFLSNPDGIFDSDLFHQGAFLVQDSSNQSLINCLATLPKKTVLDACAAPGGKLFHLEWLYAKEIEKITAWDISQKRIKRLQENKDRLKSQANIQQIDIINHHSQEKFDLVLADVPCSATGTIRKHPEIKWDRKKTDFKKNQTKQLNILESLKNLVNPNGHLVYVTCSLEIEENQQVAQIFLEKNKNLIQLVSANQLADNNEHTTNEGFLQILTNNNQMGLFAAVFKFSL